jgi:hypothetical protein
MSTAAGGCEVLVHNLSRTLLRTVPRAPNSALAACRDRTRCRGLPRQIPHCIAQAIPETPGWSRRLTKSRKNDPHGWRRMINHATDSQDAQDLTGRSCDLGRLRLSGLIARVKGRTCALVRVLPIGRVAV